MISYQEMLEIVCTEAIEYGGLLEVPGHKHGAKQSFHSAKRGARGPTVCNGDRADADAPVLHYDLRLVVESDGTLEWKD